MIQDLQFALRLFRRRPGVTALIVATLAIGMAASTVVFSLADALLWHPLPFRDPDRLVAVWSHDPVRNFSYRAVMPSALDAWQAQSQIFETVQAYSQDSLLVTGDADAQAITGGDVSAGLFGALGVHPQLGRDFVDADSRPGADPVAILSDALWRSRFGGSRDIIGRAVIVERVRHSVVGVMPPGFGFPVDSVRLWRPIAADLAGRPGRVNVIGRLRPGVSFAQAQATAEATSHQLVNRVGRALPELRVVPFMYLDPKTATAMAALLGAVALLLLIAVGNAANVLLAEAIRRDAEMTVRASIGASVGRLARQIATETLALTATAAALAVALSIGGLRMLLVGLPWVMSYRTLRPIAIDARALVFTAIIATLVGLGTALAPILRLCRTSMESSLKGTAIAATSHDWVRSMLVVLQLATTTVLLVAGGLLANGFLRMIRLDAGFPTANLLTVSVDLPVTVLPTVQAKTAFLDEWRRQASAVPGVLSATIADGAIPPRLGYDYGTIETADSGVVIATKTPVAIGRVDDRFFTTVGIPVLEGRPFSAGDRLDAPAVAVISRALADRLWPSGDALGRRFRMEGDTWHTVIGVAGNAGNGSVDDRLGDLAAYHARAQVMGSVRFEALIVRSAGDPLLLERPLRDLTRRLNSGVPITEVRTEDDLIVEGNARVRFATFLMWTLASVAVSLALIGVYGAFWCAVRQRTREIGVRLALGANPEAIVLMVLAQTARMALVGLLIGLPCAVAGSHAIRGLLFGVEPTDPLILAAASLLLVAAALAASYFPARYAGRIDPTEALRYE